MHREEDIDKRRETADRVFGERAEHYVSSAAHRDPEALQSLVDVLCPQPGWSVLDIATGAGHLALAVAPHVRSVTGIDLTPAMLAGARRLANEYGRRNASWAIADAHSLPFADVRFDCVSSRLAPHHFIEIDRALAEMRRVIAPGGALLINDRSVPEDEFVDTTMNRLDFLHDRSHVRQYRPSEWTAMLLRAGFRVTYSNLYTVNRPLSSLTKDVAPVDQAAILEILGTLDSSRRALLGFHDDGDAAFINHWYVTVLAEPV